MNGSVATADEVGDEDGAVDVFSLIAQSLRLIETVVPQMEARAEPEVPTARPWSWTGISDEDGRSSCADNGLCA
jgi:hypothetical protein